MSPRKKKAQPRFYLFLLGVLLMIVVYVYLGHDAENNRRAAEELEQANMQQESDNAELERKIGFAATDEYAEQQAREQFGYAKEGETAYVLSDD